MNFFVAGISASDYEVVYPFRLDKHRARRDLSTRGVNGAYIDFCIHQRWFQFAVNSVRQECLIKWPRNISFSAQLWILLMSGFWAHKVFDIWHDFWIWFIINVITIVILIDLNIPACNLVIMYVMQIIYFLRGNSWRWRNVWFGNKSRFSCSQSKTQQVRLFCTFYSPSTQLYYFVSELSMYRCL